MQITVIRKNELNVFTLPKEINGNFWITDYENGRKINLVNIEATEHGWQLISNPDAFLIDAKQLMIPSVILKDYSFYLLKNNYKNEMYYIYCSPVYDLTYKEFGFTDALVSVGSDSKCDICYTLSGMSDKAFTIQKGDHNFLITILDEKASVYVNHQRVLQQKMISYGDIVFSFGLKIIPMRRDGVDYLLVNNPGGLLQFHASFVNVLKQPSDFVDDHAVLSDDSMYHSEPTFFRTPHFYKTLEVYLVRIDVPPSKRGEEETPMLLTVGPMLTMSMTSIVTLLSTFSAIGSGEKSLSSSLTSLLMGIAMLASCLLWPTITKAYKKYSDKKYEAKRQKSYKKYLDQLDEKIRLELTNQKNTLLDNYFSVSKCQDIILGHNIQLWQRRITDEDFLNIPVGIGNRPMMIDIQYPEEHFSLEEDNLLEMAHELGKRQRVLQDVPITYSFFQNPVTGVVGEGSVTKAFIDRVVLQIMANYSYDEVKIVTFTSKDNEQAWDYMKTIPHSWSNDKSMRYFGSSNEDYREMTYSLDKIYQERVNQSSERYGPHYFIITDAIKSIDNYDFIKNVLTSPGYGFSLVCLVDRVAALPNECKNFIQVSRQNCSIFESVLNASVQTFRIDFTPIDYIYRCALELANITVDVKTESEASLPDVYHFLEMYQVGKVAQLNSLERWKKNNPVLSLQAPIGVGKSGEILTLDLHEKYHGPHGLVAGTTGSGKSEFIITFILSLAVNYHPYEVQVILIDYKGGSLAGAFLSDQYQLPHLAGTITNLDGNELNRSLASIESEVKRRQKAFNEAREVAHESTIDIYKYQRLWRDGKLKDMEPISHLFIISDEFAELKEQQPEFMDKLISVARVGRSLGVHLILATQKPGGVVDSQIWSNTRFRVCLKVQDTSDSQEVLKKPDAAYLKRTGRFYLQVGYDEVYTLGQSAWAGGQYYPNVTFKKEIDSSVNTINNIAYVTVSKDNDVKEEVKSCGEELPNVVQYLSNLANDEGIHVRKLWLDKIPARIYIDSLKSKYHFERVPYVLNPVIGEYDDPSSQNQFLLNVPFTKSGNVVVYGIAGSGKENFITSLLYSCMTTYAPEEVNFYLLDFGAETLRMFQDSPYVGDILYVNDEEKLKNLFKMLFQEMDHRKELFANFGGTYQSYMKSQKGSLPNIVVAINNFEVMNEVYDDYVEMMAQLTRDGFKYGIFFLVTTTSEGAMRFKIRQNFSVIYALQQNNDADYSSILGNARGKVPAKFKGRGLFRKDGIFEFQTAFVVQDDTSLSDSIVSFCQSVARNTAYRTPRVPILPKVVDYEYIKNELGSLENFVVGVNKDQLNIETFAIFKTVHNFICAYEAEDAYPFVQAFASEIYDTGCDFLFLNSTEIDFSDAVYRDRVYTTGFEEVIDKISIYIDKVYQLYENAKFDNEILKKQKHMVCFFYGAQTILSKFSTDSFKKMAKIVTQAKQMGILSFIFVDSSEAFRGFTYEEWFKPGIDLFHGIWVGNGISDQSFFKVTKITREDRAEITPEFGFIIRNGKLTKVKLLSDYKK